MAAAVGGGARWQRVPEGKGEGGEAHEAQQLTRNLGEGSGRPEELTGRRNRPGRRRPWVKMARTHASGTGLPGPIPCVGRERGSRRCRWRRRQAPGRRRTAAFGAARRRLDGAREHAGELGLGLREGEEQGERGEHGVGVLLYPPGGARSRGEAAGTATAAMATVPLLSP